MGVKPCVVVGLVLLAGGCARTPEAIRAREAERARQQRCYSIDVFEFGMTPARRYRVLGPIGLDGQFNSALRNRELQQRACQLGADAIVDVREQTLNDQPVGSNTLFSKPSISVTAVAVAYVVDEPPPPAPPPAQ